MKPTSRHHHYLPQCYLRGFTKSGSKKSKLTVIDLKGRKHFESITRNVGGARDFNRVEVEGIAPDAVESALSSFEGEVATALKKLEETHAFEGNEKELVLNLIALLTTRSPERRESWRRFHANVAEQIMSLSLATKDRWDSQMRQMKTAGRKVNENITYEDMKQFHESRAYTIQVSTEHHLHMEFFGVEVLLPHLFQRKWALITATEESGPFITTDHPVSLTWNEPEIIPPVYRYSPGYGLKETRVLFPVSRTMALIGEFNGIEGTIGATRELVAALNAMMLGSVHKQIYAPKVGFYFLGKNEEVLSGNRLLEYLNA